MSTVNPWTRATQIILAVVTAGLIIYDVFALTLGFHSTISEVMLGLGFKVPLVPLAWGTFAGHFWLPSKRVMCLWRAMVLTAIGVVVGIGGSLVLHFSGAAAWKVVFHPMVMVVLGVGVGTLFFPQTKDA